MKTILFLSLVVFIIKKKKKDFFFPHSICFLVYSPNPLSLGLALNFFGQAVVMSSCSCSLLSLFVRMYICRLVA